MSDQTATPPVRAFIQARMGSSRYPGKVLAPLLGRPVVEHVLEAAAAAVERDRIVLLTSTHHMDDPLALYVEHGGWQVFRGSLENVYQRFRDCLDMYPCEWILRICADSPFLDPGLLKAVIQFAKDENTDLVTNVFPRSFPEGQGVELIRSETFRNVDMAELDDDEREHVIPFFYNRPQRFRIINLSATPPVDVKPGYAVDTIEDLKRLEAEGRKPEFASRLGLHRIRT